MNANQHDVERLLRAGHGVIARRDHPELADCLAHLVRVGRLSPVLPGVYAEAQLAEQPRTRMLAAAAWRPAGVLTGTAAARLTFWPEVAVGDVTLAMSSRHLPQHGFDWQRRTIPPELVGRAQGLACTVPGLTALDLCLTHGGDALDVVLRSRRATVAQLHEVLCLTAGRRGNADRRRLLLDSRDDAWSPAERAAHILLRAEGITGWTGNYPLWLAGTCYYLDIAFPERKLAIEIDGRAYHSDRDAFERDRWRQNDIVLAGWRVLRFTAEMLRVPADRRGRDPASAPLTRRSAAPS